MSAAVFADMAQRTGVAAGEPGRAVCIYFHNGFRLAKVKIHRVLIGELCPIFSIVESGIGIKIDYAVKINGTGAALDAVGELLAIEVQRTDITAQKVKIGHIIQSILAVFSSR